MSHLPGQDVDEQLDPDDPLYNDIYAQVKARYEFADRLLTGKAELLDIGSGRGLGSHFLSLLPYRNLLGVDADPQCVEFAKARYAHTRLRFEHAVAPELPHSDARYDGIVCLEVIEHVEDDHELLRQVHSRLADGGVFVLSTPNRLITSPGLDRPKNPYHVREYDPDEFAALLGEHFSTVRIFGQRLRRDRRAFIAPLVEGLNGRIDALEGRVERLWVRYQRVLASTKRGAAQTVARWIGGQGGVLFTDDEAVEEHARRQRNAGFFKRLTPFLTHHASDWEFEPGECSRAPALLAVCEV
jgi:SAM-dependent methyltransferase